MIRTSLRPFALALALVVLGGCEELGNPSPFVGETPATPWSNGRVGTVTRTLSVAPGRDRTLLSHTDDGSVEYADRTAPTTGVATLVRVHPDFGALPRPSTVQLVTELTLPDGRVVGRTWAAPGAAASWDAVFGLSTPPVGARTLIVAAR